MIVCVGIGPGNLDYLTRRGEKLIRKADVIGGFTTVVSFAKALISDSMTKITMGYKDQVEKLEEIAGLHHQGKNCVILFMGDIHFSGFQYLERIQIACGHPVETVVGISSAQILASKTKVCFDETTFLTFHRRGDLEPFKNHLVTVLQQDRNAIVIPLPWGFMPKDISEYLITQGVSPIHKVEVWENLSKNEAEWEGRLEDCNLEFSDMCIMLIRTRNPTPSQI